MTKKRKKKFKKRFWFFCFAFVAILAVLGGLFFSLGGGQLDILNPDRKDGKPVTISIVDKCVEAQRNLDTLLLKQTNWQLVEKAHGNKEIVIKETGGKVQTNERLIGVGLPEDMTPEAGSVWLKKKLVGTGLYYLGGEEALYKDMYPGYRCQVGIQVKSGSTKRDFVTDTIHFYNNLNLNKQTSVIAEKRHFNGKLAIIIDDCGTDIKAVRTLLNLDIPFTFSILPNKDFSSDILAAVNTKGRVALLHLPMEPINRAAMSEGSNTIVTEMTNQQISDLTRRHLKGLYGVMGVNNHQGSKITANREQMKAVLNVLKEQGIFFVDSKTNSETIARDVAREMGVKTCMNDKFLDNSTNPEAIKEEVYKVMELAEQNGSAIAICHARPNTVAMWSKYVQEFKDTGITFVSVNELLY